MATLKNKIFASLASLVLIFSLINGMEFDNRYFPLYLKPYIREVNRPSYLVIQPFAMTGKHAYDIYAEKGAIPTTLYGLYDENGMDQALILGGYTQKSLFRSDLVNGGPYNWDTPGRIEAQGLAINYYQALTCHFSVGFSVLAMRVESHEVFKKLLTQFPPVGDFLEYLNVNSQISEILKLQPPQFREYGVGDADFFIRFSKFWDHAAKCRTIDAGVKLGVIFPSGVKTDIFNPASVPFGGDGFWGMYLSFDGDFELKEDISVGGMFRLIKRFEKTFVKRMPIINEPTNYGVLVGPVKIDPGLTYVISPNFTIEALRKGFGLQFVYTYVKHKKDSWVYLGKQVPPFPLLEAVESRSSWTMEHVTVTALYDFKKRGSLPGIKTYSISILGYTRCLFWSKAIS